MQLPPRDQWLTIAQASDLMGASRFSVYRAVHNGRKSPFGGELIHLQAWATLRGVVTTRTAIDAFHAKLSGRSTQKAGLHL